MILVISSACAFILRFEQSRSSATRSLSFLVEALCYRLDICGRVQVSWFPQLGASTLSPPWARKVPPRCLTPDPRPVQGCLFLDDLNIEINCVLLDYGQYDSIW